MRDPRGKGHGVPQKIVSFAPTGLVGVLRKLTHGLRRGLRSAAASRQDEW